MSKFTVAAIQAGSTLFDTEATLQQALAYIGEAAEQSASLVVLPEAYLGGYPKGLDFGITVGSRSSQGREEFQRYFDSAIAVPGPETDALAEAANTHGLTIVIGVIERDGGTLYCTSLFFTPEDGLAAKHRKLLPTAAERYLWGRGDGSTLETIETQLGTVGSAICWENYMPLLRQTMYSKGVDIWCAPTVDEREVWGSTMRHIALEGRCFVISANQYLQRRDLPDDVHPVQGEDRDTTLISGGSMIVSPLGRVLAGPKCDGAGLLLAEIDLDELAQAKFDFDAGGHYARPDVFTLLVDEEEKHTTYGL
ncbi:Carbon-nitrogen hydrolase [Brevibacterium sp. 239c]|uniref:carbon-nitrogen hydrolase family protein n=1 Tax=Brevibacterium sp. 239c TaxID=1965356 RepID=UPI000C622B43|nr:carbon-nitrogen hydrolase family protein [Brevibacterium sp. 239c]SMX67961.1 Carbon-nitrogen hydrolase [Brevibacterium sp. 239c]